MLQQELNVIIVRLFATPLFIGRMIRKIELSISYARLGIRQENID